MRAPTLLPLVACLSLASCTVNQWELELRPQGETVERQLAWKPMDSLSRQWLGSNEAKRFDDRKTAKHLSEVYGEPKSRDEQRRVYRKTFGAAMPQDLGGHGQYWSHASDLGRSSAYLEVIRGPKHPGDDMMERHRAADDLTLLLQLILESELQLEEDDPILTEFSDLQVRKFLRDVAVISMSHELLTPLDERAWSSAMSMVLHAALRGGLLEAAEVEELLIHLQSDDQEQALLQAVPKLAIVKRYPALAKLIEAWRSQASATKSRNPESSNSESAGASKKAWSHLEDKPRIRKLVQSRGRKDLEDLSQDLLSRVLGALLPRNHDKLVLRLATGVEPYHSNGEYDPTTKTITWEVDRLPMNDEWAARSYFATWSNPDVAAQTQLFGSVVLQGQELALYCAWWQSLTPQQRREWQRFVASLQGTEDRPAKLAAFRFAHTETGSAPASAPRGAQLLTTALADR